jgi:chromosome segregation ATPase
MNDQEPKYFTKFKNELYEKLDAHEEQIAYLTEEITGIKSDISGVNGEIVGIKDEIKVINVEITDIKGEITGIKSEITGIKSEITGIKGELVEVNKKLDSHEEQIVHVSEQGSQILKVLNSKADSTYVENIDFRTKKLEKFVFV